MSESEKVKEHPTIDKNNEVVPDDNEVIKNDKTKEEIVPEVIEKDKTKEEVVHEGNEVIEKDESDVPKEDLSSDKDRSCNKDKESLDKKGEEPAPKPQRKPRLNRRSFHLSSGLNGCENTKSQKDTDEKKIISLNPAKKTPFESKSAKEPETAKKIILKKSTSDVQVKRTSDSADISKSSEPQPKKKHKPITWP